MKIRKWDIKLSLFADDKIEWYDCVAITQETQLKNYYKNKIVQ